ncbi:MAG TPA: 1-phosphofructokinase family hexose kinase [Pyrinomonadaceae bacterium]|jgi:tagatose 6-phosphate kinase
MILIVNLNLAVDEIVHLDGFTVGEVHRTNHVERLAGGKGVNVARVLKALNERALLAGFLGGRAGDFIARELQREELPLSCVPVQNESRTCIILNDGATRTQTVINEAGAEVSEEEMRSFHEHYAQLLSSHDLVVITGSLPPKLSTDVYARLISTANEAGKPVLLDTSSKPLRASLSAQPFIVKINGAEAGELSGLGINDFDDAMRATRKLIEMGSRHAMITLGAPGAVLNFEGVMYRIKSPRIEALNSVGSGDAVLAGLAAGLMRGLEVEELARLAVAAGAANALRGAGRCELEDIYRLVQDVEFL